MPGTNEITVYLYSLNQRIQGYKENIQRIKAKKVSYSIDKEYQTYKIQFWERKIAQLEKEFYEYVKKSYQDYVKQCIE